MVRVTLSRVRCGHILHGIRGIAEDGTMSGVTGRQSLNDVGMSLKGDKWHCSLKR